MLLLLLLLLLFCCCCKFHVQIDPVYLQIPTIQTNMHTARTAVAMTIWHLPPSILTLLDNFS